MGVLFEVLRIKMDPRLDLACLSSFKKTHEFDGVSPGLNGVSCNPDVLQIGEGKLVGTVLDMIREQGVVHQRDGPEFGDGSDDLAALFVYRGELGLGLTL
jgi:hypothetical protein